MVQTVSAGVDWIVDRVPEGVTLCSARGARDRAMAEWVVAAILADAKRARECAEQQAAAIGSSSGSATRRACGCSMVGFGSIGRALEAMLAPSTARSCGVARRARDGVHGIDELA